MNVSPVKIRVPFLLFILISSLMGFAESPETWSKVSLSNEDSRGAKALLVLIRNADRFAQWLAKTGGPLTPNSEGKLNTVVAVSRFPNATKKNEEIITQIIKKVSVKKIVRTRTSVTRYVVAEKNDKGNYSRVLLVDEKVTTRDVSKKRNPKANVIDETAPEEILEESVKRAYPAITLDLAGTESGKYEEALFLLERKDAPKSLDIDGANEQISLISPEATALVIKASATAGALAKEITNIQSEGKLEIDESSPKSVTYLVSSKGRMKDVTCSGFVKAKNEKLETADSRSAWVVTLNGILGNSNQLDVKIVNRKDTEEKIENAAALFK